MDNYSILLSKKKAELEENIPLVSGVWNKDYLCEYLVYLNCSDTEKMLWSFFKEHLKDRKLAEMLFDFLLDESYNGSDAQIGAVFLMRNMDRDVLKECRHLILQVKKSKAKWKIPFNDKELKDIFN